MLKMVNSPPLFSDSHGRNTKAAFDASWNKIDSPTAPPGGVEYRGRQHTHGDHEELEQPERRLHMTQMKTSSPETTTPVRGVVEPNPLGGPNFNDKAPKSRAATCTDDASKPKPATSSSS